MRNASRPRRKGDEELPASLPQRFPPPKWVLPVLTVLALAALFWPARELRSNNFVIYLPSRHSAVPLETSGSAKFLPLLPVLNLVGKVGGIQERKNALRVFFGATQIELRQNDTSVQVDKSRYELFQPVHLSDGQWMVPVSFLTIVLPRLTHEAVEYQQGTNRIFIGDVKPASFTVRLDPVANGARLTVQFTEQVAVHAESTNGKWVVFLGDRPMEPMEPFYRFPNPYLSELQYDDQDGVPKLILTPASTGLNFYPAQAEGGKILLADVLKPSSPSAQVSPSQPPSGPTPEGPAGQVTESPIAPSGPPLPVVMLDAGHGGTDNGAHSHDGVWEKDLTVQYVIRARTALLATNKYRVMLTRVADLNVTFEQRALLANVTGAIYFLSFHAGDLGTASPRICIFTFEPPTPAPAADAETPPPVFVPWGQVQEARLDQSRQLALALQQQFALISGVDAAMPSSAPVRTLRSVNAPAVAIELGGLSPDANATALINPVFQQQVATAVVQALASFEKGVSTP
jgi:N-acetylmuramoyl-L-alanine amidase